jgi:23S rRNA (adenine2503-C2)-methyltransferase
MIIVPPLRPLVTDLTSAQLAQWCVEQGQKSFRADQIRRWIFSRRANSFDEMHDVPAVLRARLAESFDFFGSEVTRHQVSRDGTEKLLLTLRDGEQIETVLMREEERRTICVSSQVGCAMGCIFCASGLNGVKRNLTMGEILDQVLRIDRLLPVEERITNLVVMGMGEPLANLKNVLPALETLNQKGGMGIGARRITVSTVGLPEKIREFAKVGHAYNLAVSLHAPNDDLRTRIVPVNKTIGIAEILKAADEHFEATGRRVTYEYCLMAGINDDPAQARELVKLMQGRVAHVNVIPMNPVASIDCQTPSLPRTQAFVETLERGGIVVTVRKRKGADIDAACGQLRINAQKPEPESTLPVLQAN